MCSSDLGLVLDASVAPFWWPFDPATWLYWLATGTLLLMTAVTLHIVRGRHGRAMMALRDHPIAAASIGIPVAAVKAKAFAVSAMYAGIAGGLSAALVRYVGPDSFDVFLSISFLVGIVVGGAVYVSGNKQYTDKVKHLVSSSGALSGCVTDLSITKAGTYTLYYVSKGSLRINGANDGCASEDVLPIAADPSAPDVTLIPTNADGKIGRAHV